MATTVMTKAARTSEAGPVTIGHRKLIRGFVGVGSNLAGATTSASRTDRTSPFKRASLRTGWPEWKLVPFYGTRVSRQGCCKEVIEIVKSLRPPIHGQALARDAHSWYAYY